MANNLLRDEADTTCKVLRGAALLLAGWANLVREAGNVDDIIPAEHLRELSRSLARQGGRLEMAKAMTRKRKDG